MKFGVILPHTLLYGGVKRFLELGNIFVEKGHEFYVFTPDGKGPDWFDFKGEMRTMRQLPTTEVEVLFTTTVKYVHDLLESRAQHKVFYHVRRNEKVKEIMMDPRIEVFACSTNIYDYDFKKFGKSTFKAVGGVNVANYKAKTDYSVGDRPFIVMAYGRLSERVKGTHYVISACEKLYKKGYDVKLLLFDTPTSKKAEAKDRKFKCACPFDFVLNHPFDQNSELFNRADIFVSAENPKYSGWNNTVAEAMACGLPVISTKAGTADILQDGKNGIRSARWGFCFRRHIKKLYKSEKLRRKYGEAARESIKEFDWHALADRILEHFGANTTPQLTAQEVPALPEPELPAQPETVVEVLPEPTTPAQTPWERLHANDSTPNA